MDDRKANWDSGLEYAVLSDIGLRRNNNQDAFTTAVAGSETQWRQRGHLFVVADGMGAHAAGELASKMAVEKIPHLYRKLTDDSAPVALRAAIETANAEIHGRGQANLEFHGMGTTSSCLLLMPDGAYVAHVGDSRVYRMRGSQLDQLTFDHSLVWEMRASGQLRDNEMANHVPKNIITRSLGPNAQVLVDVEGPFPLAQGDVFMLCSDGLTGQVADDEIGNILACLPPPEAAQALVDLANLRGGPDNITVEVVRVAGPQLAGGGTAQEAAGESAGISVWLWLLAAILAAAAGGLLLLGQIVGSVVLAGLAAAAALAAALRGKSPPQAGPVESRRFGRAPYTSGIYQADAGLSERLAGVYKQLEDAATSEDWAIDWSRARGLSRQAEMAVVARNYQAAVQQYCRVISFMMFELRNQKKKRNGGSKAEI